MHPDKTASSRYKNQTEVPLFVARAYVHNLTAYRRYLESLAARSFLFHKWSGFASLDSICSVYSVANLGSRYYTSPRDTALSVG